MGAQRVESVTPYEDAQLATVEDGDLEFTRLDNPMINLTSYFHRRMIGEAVVEKDFIRYVFDRTTGELVEEVRNWRPGLPTKVATNVSQSSAEALAPGDVRSSTLMIIAPDSEIFRFQPTPIHPCWVVHSENDAGSQVITVVDAVTGEVLGNGIPPPAEGLSIHGPDWGACPQSPIWYDWAKNARDWFETMGYDTDQIGNASEATIQGYVTSDNTVMFYELDHGGATSFHNRCDQDISATEIESWIAPYASMGFSFIGSCGGLCSTGEDTFATEFRKGHNTDSAVVGYCDMDATECDDCWPDSIAWQTELFRRMDQGYTVSYAYALANAAYPDCSDDSHYCMRVSGDTALVFGGSTYPEVHRSFAGNVYDICIPPFGCFSPWSPVASTYYTRAHHVRGTTTVPSGYSLTVSVSSSYPYNEVAFSNSAVLTSTGSMTANASGGTRVSFVSAADKNKGVHIESTGQLKMLNGGQIRIYE